MLCKLYLVVSLAVGVLGRSTPNPYSEHNFIDEYSQVVATDYCKATNAEGNTAEVKASIKKFAIHATAVLNPDEINRDVEVATRIGSYDSLIKKYCTKVFQLKDSIRELFKGMAPCLVEGNKIEKTWIVIIDFLCDNEGDRITSFIRDDGISCIKSARSELAVCQSEMQANVSRAAIAHGASGLSGALLIPDKDKCAIIDDYMTCFTNALRVCPKKTPGKLAQELQVMYLDIMGCNGESYETQTEAAVDKNTTAQALSSSGRRNSVDSLMKRKLELEVRTAELETWNRENELQVQHTSLTSDVKKRL